MSKLTRETVATSIPLEDLAPKKRDRLGEKARRRTEAKRAMKEYRKESKRRCGDDDVTDAVKQLTEEIRQDRADRSRGVGQVPESLSRHRKDADDDHARAHATSGARRVDRPRGRVRSQSRDREPQRSRWSQSAWRVGGWRRGEARRGARR